MKKRYTVTYGASHSQEHSIDFDSQIESETFVKLLHNLNWCIFKNIDTGNRQTKPILVNRGEEIMFDTREDDDGFYDDLYDDEYEYEDEYYHEEDWCDDDEEYLD